MKLSLGLVFRANWEKSLSTPWDNAPLLELLAAGEAPLVSE
jgi:hypothetical protein